ncbi:hypothetical protein OPQ81_008873 [Rhizoctonia solani]|nr:hypothetical protein OPQ81_008873 [Rhizoctonia solani]
MSGILMLAEALLNTETAQEVHGHITMNSHFRGANKLLPIVQGDRDSKPELCPVATNTDYELGNVAKDGTRGHVRGVNGSVYAG